VRDARSQDGGALMTTTFPASPTNGQIHSPGGIAMREFQR
jgi:hypothetical protein